METSRMQRMEKNEMKEGKLCIYRNPLPADQLSKSEIEMQGKIVKINSLPPHFKEPWCNFVFVNIPCKDHDWEYADVENLYRV